MQQIDNVLIVNIVIVLPKLLHKFNVIPIKITVKLWFDIDNIILKHMWKGEEIRIVKTIFIRKIMWEELVYLI